MHIKHTLLPLIVLMTTPPTLAFASQVEPASCQSQRVQLQMLGTRGPEFLDENASTGYLIWLDDKARVIVDAGPGSLQRFKQSKANYEDVELMLFSHFHADHSADFPSYVKSGFFTGRTKTLDVIGPSGSKFAPSAEQFVKRAIGKKAGMYPYLGEFIDPDVPSSYKIKTRNIPWSSKHLSIKEIYHKNGVSVKAVPTYHGPFPSVGYRVELAGCVISFTGDMSGQFGAMPKLAKDSDILIAHNAIPENATGIAANLHMTPSYIGKMAKEANVKKLLLTHMMKRSISVNPETQKTIEKHYKGEIVFPNDLDVFNP